MLVTGGPIRQLWQYTGVWEVVTQHSDGQRCSGGSRHLIRVQCLVERPDRWPERTGVAWREVGCREDSQRGSRVRCMPLVLIDPSLLERCSTNEVSQDLGLRRHPPWRRAEKASLPGSETGAGRGISRQVWSFGCPALAMVTVVLASRWAKQRASGEALSSWVVALGAWAGRVAARWVTRPSQTGRPKVYCVQEHGRPWHDLKSQDRLMPIPRCMRRRGRHVHHCS